MNKAIKIPNAQQVASQIDENNNGFSSMAQAFIAIIKGCDLTDATAIHLFRSTVSIKSADNRSHWPMASYCL